MPSDFPVDHPIKIFCAKLMSLSCDIFMGKWRLWHIGRRRKRERVHQQYLAMCDHYHLTPVGVQSIHRYMLSRYQFDCFAISVAAMGAVVTAARYLRLIQSLSILRTSSFMNLSGQGISKLAIKCMLEAFTGTFRRICHAMSSPDMDFAAIRDRRVADGYYPHPLPTVFVVC